MLNYNKGGYRLVFSDIDGTLLDSSHRIGERTRLAIKSLEREGVPFVLVSARMPEGIFKIQDRLGIQAPIVSYSGGLILDSERRVQDSRGFPLSAALELKERLAAGWPDICVNTYAGSLWLVEDADNPWVKGESRIVGFAPRQGTLSKEWVPDGVVHKLMCLGEADRIARLEQELCVQYPNLSISRSKPEYLEIMSKSAVKSHGVEFLCGALGVKSSASVAFGDQYNDVDMLLAAGLGVAMGNAPEGVKQKADAVTGDNDHEGLLCMLERLFYLPQNGEALRG